MLGEIAPHTLGGSGQPTEETTIDTSRGDLATALVGALDFSGLARR